MRSTSHRFLCSDSRSLPSVDTETVHLCITSPPYPMIEMWDEVFSNACPGLSSLIEAGEGMDTFEAMHDYLDQVWKEVYRVLIPGGIACINIGDAVRSIGGEFRLYPNHARIISAAMAQGFSCLPLILWRKQTNAPNKFMGSGMLPPGAYVTLEHEYILIFRKGGMRRFRDESDKERRRESAYFWEERNKWFSDLWDFKGVRQNFVDTESRERSAAFPLELSLRLTLMYSMTGDTVLDPFSGTGTTAYAAMALGRNSISADIEEDFLTFIPRKLPGAEELNAIVRKRLRDHEEWIESTQSKGKTIRYTNRYGNFPVFTRQEQSMKIPEITSVEGNGSDMIVVRYSDS